MSDLENWGGCEEALKFFKIDLPKYGCCTSCHDDADSGEYSLCVRYVDDGYFEVCCSVSFVIDSRRIND